MARNKEFDKQKVLSKATKIFLELGYEKTSMQNLVDAMGIQRGSIYDTFGDKRNLFKRCLSVFSEQIAIETRELCDIDDSYRQKILIILTHFVASSSGCLLVNTATELGFLDTEIQEKISEEFSKTKNTFKRYIQAGQQNGEFQNMDDPNILAEAIHNVSIGLRVYVKIIDNPKQLQQIIQTSLQLLDMKNNN